MTSEKKRSLRRYSAEMKTRVVAACGEDGTSVAKVAMAHGINASVVHRWHQHARNGSCLTAAKTGGFIALPLAVPPVTATAPSDIRVELRRGALTMTVTWPSSAAADFAAWTRELLRKRAANPS